MCKINLAADWTARCKKAVTFSYDDGVYQDIRLIELLDKYGLKATFNLNSGLMSPESAWQGDGVRVERIPPEIAAEVYRGHEIASHSRKHLNLRSLDSHAIFADVTDDMKQLGQIFNRAVDGFAYPYGATDSRVKTVLRECGVKYARVAASSGSFDPPTDLLETVPTCRHKDDDIFDLAEKFIALSPSEPKIFMVWGHSYEFDMQRGWERFENFCKIISGRDDIFYGSCGEVLQHFAAYR